MVHSIRIVHFVLETLNVKLPNGEEIILNGTFEGVLQNETRALEGSVLDIKRGIEMHLNVS